MLKRVNYGQTANLTDIVKAPFIAQYDNKNKSISSTFRYRLLGVAWLDGCVA